MKRSFDLLASALGLLLFAPLLLVLALAVWISSGRPILFRQQRVGRHGRDFTLLKFRTMRPAAPPLTSDLRSLASGNASFDAGNTSRVTPIGRLLRKTKLDELPQLYNVLRGDMSLVGPRPEVRKWVEVYPERWAIIHTARPGITDPASIAFRHEEDLLAASPDPERTYREQVLPQKLALYESYIRTRSFWGDIGIIMKTIAVVLGVGSKAESRKQK